jgi:hypothetical protein
LNSSSVTEAAGLLVPLAGVDGEAFGFHGTAQLLKPLKLSPRWTGQFVHLTFCQLFRISAHLPGISGIDPVANRASLLGKKS